MVQELSCDPEWILFNNKVSFIYNYYSLDSHVYGSKIKISLFMTAISLLIISQRISVNIKHKKLTAYKRTYLQIIVKTNN